MKKHPQLLLKNVRFPDQNTIAGYEHRDGYKVIRNVLKLEPQKVIDEVKLSGLRGRGGAGFSAGTKWGLSLIHI